MIFRLEIKKRDHNLYVGECLELGLASQGETPDECKRQLLNALEAFIEAAQEVETKKIGISPVSFYRARKVIFDLRYSLQRRSKNRHNKNRYFKDTRSVPIGI